jgi:hypothetical protein
MSLHSKLSPEALMSLRRQRRISTIASLVIAVLLITIMALILSFLILESIIRDTPVIVTYQANTPEEKPVEAKKVHSNPARKPSAPSSAIARVIGANAESPVAVPVPDQVVTEPSLDFGSSDDFGKGWEDGFGDGSGAGDGGGFGSGSGASGGLPGILYDLKQDRGNKPLPQSMQLYGSTLLEIQEGFRDSNLNKYFRAPKVLYLTHLAVPLKDASEGPSSFNAQDSIKPTYWMAHYSGTLVVPRTGTYRFSGTGDNYLHVRIDGKTCLHFGNSVPKGWQPTPPTAQNHQSPYVKGWHVHYGDWLNFRAGQEIRIDLGIGESGGGMVGFILQIEERGGKYRTDTKNNNRPILPLFTTAPFSSEEIQRLRSEFGAYEIDFTNVPVFRLRR